MSTHALFDLEPPEPPERPAVSGALIGHLLFGVGGLAVGFLLGFTSFGAWVVEALL